MSVNALQVHFKSITLGCAICYITSYNTNEAVIWVTLRIQKAL